jgi:hypothetical protein
MRRLVREAADAARTFALLACGALVLISGCTSGDGGIAPGGGQDPDPVVLDFPIAYVKRPVPADDTMMTQDARRLEQFEPGGDLYVRDRAAPSAPETNVTGELTQGMGDVRDAEASFDGTKIVFALHLPMIEGADPEDQPTWNVWEYEAATKQLHRVIPSDIVAEEGDDIMPHYLPDGRIVFSSTRQRQSKAILLDEGKPQFEAQDEDRKEPAFLLHVMNADGSDIHQISFNQSHDLDPSVMDDGRIIFSRWDHAGGNNEIILYAMRPDGTQLELLYGAQSHATGTDGSDIEFLNPQPADNGNIIVRAQPFVATDLGGDLLEIDVANYVENTQPTAANRGVMNGPAQKPATVQVVRTIEGPSPGGRFGSAFPLRTALGAARELTQCRWSRTRRRAVHRRQPGCDGACARAVRATCTTVTTHADADRRAGRGCDLDAVAAEAGAAGGARRPRRGCRPRCAARAGGRRHPEHPQRLRRRRRRHDTRRHSPACGPRCDDRGAASRAFHAHREGREHPRR